MTSIVHLQELKQKNMARILQSLWRRSTSRVELVTETGLTSGTITNLVQELMDWHVVRECGRISGAVGRRRVALRFDDRLHSMVGIDIGRTNFAVVVLDLSGRAIFTAGGELPRGHHPDSTMELVVRRAAGLIARAAAVGYTVLGVGVGIPGPMDTGAGTLLEPPNFPGWRHFPVSDAVGRGLSLPVWLEDDAHTSALAERWYGCGRVGGDLVFVTMGVGIGSGVIVNGELMHGAHDLCGQLGHMTVIPGGERCACGNIGCWETVGSIPSVVRRYGEEVSVGQVFARAEAGEARAGKVVDETIDFLVTALINVCNLYDPAVVVLGGRMFSAFSSRLEQIADGVRSRAYASVRDHIRIAAAAFGEQQSAMGAAALVLHALMTEPLRTLQASGGGRGR